MMVDRCSGTRPACTRVGAFTLIELLVVVSILALLISILIPSLVSARRQGKRIACAANARELAVGVHLFSTEHNGWVPKAWFNGRTNAINDPQIATPADAAAIEPDFGYGYPAYGWDSVLAHIMRVDHTSAVFRCPEDRSNIRRGTWNDEDPNLPIRPDEDNFFASYRMNISNQADGLAGSLVDRLRTASAAILICEGVADPFHHVARWENLSPGQVSRTNTRNIALDRHGKGDPLNYVFFDGHAGVLSWEATWEPTGGDVYVKGQGDTKLTAWRQIYAPDRFGRVGRDLP